MSRTPLPFHSDDISALARSLNGQLTKCEHLPGHVELLNMLARATGWRNFQHFRAQKVARERLDAPAPEPAQAPVDYVRVQRLLRHFDVQGRLVRWPGKFSDKEPCLWGLWSKLPPRQVFTESEISRWLQAHHLFGDHALLRRELCDRGLVARTADGRVYRRIERQPPVEALALIRYLGERRTD